MCEFLWLYVELDVIIFIICKLVVLQDYFGCVDVVDVVWVVYFLVGGKLCQVVLMGLFK